MRTRKDSCARTDSLIQTIGRAARNLNGRAILYADKITGSMQRALDETERRRAKQIEFNTANGIDAPRHQQDHQGHHGRGAVGAVEFGQAARRQGQRQGRREGASGSRSDASPEQIVREIKRLEAEMFKHARNLEFEEAAALRDEIETLKLRELGLPPAAA